MQKYESQVIVGDKLLDVLLMLNKQECKLPSWGQRNNTPYSPSFSDHHMSQCLFLLFLLCALGYIGLDFLATMYRIWTQVKQNCVLAHGIRKPRSAVSIDLLRDSNDMIEIRCLLLNLSVLCFLSKLLSFVYLKPNWFFSFESHT